MTQEQIKKILSDYKTLQQRTVELVNLLHESKLDNSKFPFGLTSIEDADSFDYTDDMVYVGYSYSIWGGDTEYVSCSFPIKYFSQSNKEILDDVRYQRDKEIERKRMEKEEKVKKEKADKEAKEREQYEKLKAKFEIPTITNDDEEPFNTIEEAKHEAEIFYPGDVIVSTKTGPILCETVKCNAWQPNGEYSYYFQPKKQ